MNLNSLRHPNGTMSSDTQQFCTFWLGEHYFGIDIQRVQEVVRPMPITPVPHAPRAVRGLINLRGQIVTAIDLRERLGLPGSPKQGESMNVVLNSPDGLLAILVDEVADVQTVSPADFERTPETVRGLVRTLLRGAYKLPRRLLLILDEQRLMDFRV